MTKKGFSLVELVIALGIIIIMTGAAALYLGDIYFKSQVAKSLGDMEVIANSLLLHDTENGADLFETELPGFEGTENWYGEKDSLKSLLGNYLAVLPSDPWGNPYKVNAYAGYIRTYAGDYKIGGTSKYEKDISQYYLPEDLAVSKVRIEDANANLLVDTDDVLSVYFTKSVRANITDTESGADVRGRTAAAGAIAGATATGYFTGVDFYGVRPDGTELSADPDNGTGLQSLLYSRPEDTPYTDSNYSRKLVVTLDNQSSGGADTYDASDDMFKNMWYIGNEVYIPTGGDAGNDRSRAYVIWESTQGYKTYKTTGEINKLYLLKQAPENSKRVVLFKGLID